MSITEPAKALSSSTLCSFQVLLSFRSNHTCKIFIDNLYTALTQAGIETFINSDERGRGKDFCPEMRQAVKQSRMSIIIFTEDFAFSKWCLDELVTVLKRKENGHMVLPIFFYVDPSHVRKQRGCFADAFLEYDKQIRAEECSDRKLEAINRVQRWRASLEDVANLAGMVIEDGREFELIQEIVERTWIKLSFNIPDIAPYLIGVYSRIKELCLWLKDDSISISMSMIYGTAGIGKTTMVEILYRLFCGRFELSCFVSDTKEYTGRNNGLVCLQKRILLDILKVRTVEVHDVHHGALKIKETLSCKKFLLVLDDVDQVEQLNAVLGLRDWIPAGSKIILTTMNEGLLIPNDNCFMYKVKELDDDESLQLFSWHAFRQKHPMKGYMDQSKKITLYCKGIPLALQVLGSSLAGAAFDLWENMLQKLDGISESHIKNILELGYDNLHDDQEKHLFLDIACFFVGRDKDYVVKILDECDFYTTAGIQSLVDKCLVRINRQNKLMIHHSNKEMAKEIIHRESFGEEGKYSRIWDSENGLSLLTEKLGGESIEGLNLDFDAFGKNSSEYRNVSNRHHFKDCRDNSSRSFRFSLLSRFKINSSMTATGSLSGTSSLGTDAFSNMLNLRLLQLNRVQLRGTYKEFPKKIKWLCWDKYQSSSLPLDFPMDHLTVLEMHYSNLERIWKGTKRLRSLKVLDLSHSLSLTRSPDFSGFPRLERLILEDCKNLIEIHESIGQLWMLSHLNLRGCGNLGELPKEVGNVRSLKNINLSGCMKLNFLMATDNKNRSLIHDSKRPSRSFNRKYSVFPSDRTKTRSASAMLQFLPCGMTNLDLSVCNLTGQGIPSDLSFLSSLLYLNLSENPISNLPKSIKTLNYLLSLELFGCKQLELLPELPSSLIKLDARSCASLKRITNLPNYMRSLDLQLADCVELVEVETLFKMKPIKEIDGPRNFRSRIDLKHVEGVQLEFYNHLTFTRKETPVQVLYEFGIFSTFVPGNTVPDGFTMNNGFPVCLIMPPIKKRGLEICVIYKPNNTRERQDFKKRFITICNETKGITWVYTPVVFAHSLSSDETIMWLSYWTFCDDQLERGDRIMVSLNMTCNVVEFGINPFGEEIDEAAGQVHGDKGMEENPRFRPVIESDWSEYQLYSDVYFLAHHS